MELNALRQAEQRIWETVQAVAPACVAIEASNPWNKLTGRMQLPVGIHGQGLLSWLPSNRLPKIRSVSSSPVVGDQLQIQLILSGAATVPLDLTLLVRSSWSRVGIPMTQAMVWPEGVVIGSEEEATALSYEADYLCLWVQRSLDDPAALGRLFAFKKGDYRRFEVQALGELLRDEEYQHAYFNYLNVGSNHPRHSRSFPAHKPESPFLVIHKDNDTNALPRLSTRLFKEHWIFEVLNLHDPILRLTKETSWETSSTSPNTEPGSTPSSSGSPP